MKRLKLIACFGILLLGCMGVVSCSVEEEISKAGADGSVTLQLNSSLIDTRATAVGNDTFNENEINDVHVFFYPADGTGSALHRHVAKANIEEVSNVQGKTTITFPSSEMTDVFPNNATKAAVYAIANLPEGTEIPAETSIESLKKIAITADFSEKQESFVMDGQAEVTLNRTAMTVAGTIDLKRAASQIALFVTEIKGEIKDPTDGKMWTADPTGMQVEFYNGVQDAIVDVTADDTYTVDNDFYVRTAQTRNFADDKTGEGEDAAYAQESPFYSYSSDWSGSTENTAYMKLIVPWKKGEENEYRSCFYMVPINLEGQKFERNTYYKIMIEVSILGSFLPDQPFELKPSYVIMDWSTETFIASIDEYKYLVVDETYKEIFNVTDCRIAYSSSSPITVKVTKVEYTSYNTGSEVTNTFEGDEAAAFATPAVNEDNTFTLNHSLAGPSSKYVPYTFTLLVENKDGMSEEVKIVQYPSLYISMGAGDDIFINGYFARVANAKLPGATMWTEAKMKESATDYATDANARDDRAGLRYYSYDETIEYYDKNSHTNYTTWGNYILYFRDDHVRTYYGNIYTYLRNSAVRIMGTTNVYVTAFDSGNNTYSDGTTTHTYRIGDPRVPSGWDDNLNANDNNGIENGLKGYLSGQRIEGSRYYRDFTLWDDASQIQVATKEKNIIAPAFKISSGFAITNPLEYNKMVKRCATYQEAGYPAGRWRLPTEAEIMFVRDNLQNHNIIQPLFVPTTVYWASSGRTIRGAKISESTPTAVNYSRCVYDIWYWGDEAKDASTYHGEEPKQ